MAQVAGSEQPLLFKRCHESPPPPSPSLWWRDREARGGEARRWAGPVASPGRRGGGLPSGARAPHRTVAERSAHHQSGGVRSVGMLGVTVEKK